MEKKLSFGANLKRERKLRGITLEEIAQETKIPLQNLRYIETDQFNRLPEGIFRESFIRSYSRYLGINEEKTAHEFLFVTKHNPSSEISEDPTSPSKTFSVPFPKKEYPTKKWWANLLLGMAALSAILLLFFFSKNWQDSNNHKIKHSLYSPTDKNQKLFKNTDQDSMYEKQPLKSLSGSTLDRIGTPKILDALSPKQTIVSKDKTEFKIITPDPVLNIKAIKKTWVTVKNNSTILFSGLLKSQESKKFSLKRPLRLIIPEPKNVELLVNNERFKTLEEKEVLLISTENYRHFLATVD